MGAARACPVSARYALGRKLYYGSYTADVCPLHGEPDQPDALPGLPTDRPWLRVRNERQGIAGCGGGRVARPRSGSGRSNVATNGTTAVPGAQARTVTTRVGAGRTSGLGPHRPVGAPGGSAGLAAQSLLCTHRRSPALVDALECRGGEVA